MSERRRMQEKKDRMKRKRIIERNRQTLERHAKERKEAREKQPKN